jgi:Lipopolysaccharide kinase (Kdo/WaaP) family
MMKAATRLRSGTPAPQTAADFPKFVLGRRVVYLHRNLSDRAPVVSQLLSELRSANGAGNRQGGFRLKLDDELELFVRVNRRGGLARVLFKELYFGRAARPLRELAITAEAARRGIPVAEPLGAVVEWLAPLAYRGAVLTRAMSGMTLWEFVRTDDDDDVRRHVLELTGRTLDLMHRRGLFHADLNLHNLFVTQAFESFRIAIIDLDKARLFRSAVPPRMRQRNLARLRRSARKLDPNGRYFDVAALERLTAR